MSHCPVCGAPWSEDRPHCCGNVGPRIGQQAPRCVRPPGHDGDHQAHESWNAAVGADSKPLTWADLCPAQLPPGYSVVRLDVDDLAHIIRTADGDRLARSDELAAHIIDALTKET